MKYLQENNCVAVFYKILLQDFCNGLDTCSNLPVAQNGRFVTNLVYSVSSTMVAIRVKILDFSLSKDHKMHSLGPFSLPIYFSRKFALSLWELYWIFMWHKHTSFNNSLFSSTAHLMIQKLKSQFILKLVPGIFFCLCQHNSTWIYCSW